MVTDREALLLQVSADISKLEKAFARAQGVVDKSSKAMENRSKQAATNLEKFFGKSDPGKALDKIFDATRFKVLDSGIARVGIFGGALESLGPAGLAAAAGVGALAAAFAGARDAAKFADDINDTADRLHVTTDALQEYRYAIRAAGGEEKGADDALEAFSVNLGKAQEGLKKSQRAFLALGFTRDQIKGFTDADSALKAVTERIAGLSNVQKDAIIDQLGLTGLKPLIEGGADAMQRLRDEAHKVGIVMDADLVRRGGELNDKFETVEKVINLQLKSALVDLGPILLGLLGLMADLARAAANVADAFRNIQDKSDAGLEAQAKTLRKEIAILENARANGSGVSQRVIDAKTAELSTIAAQQAERKAAHAPPPPPKPTRSLIDQSPPGPKGPADDTRAKTDEVDAKVAAANRELLQAQLALTGNVEDRARLQKAIADQERDIATAGLEKQKAQIDADKGISAATKLALKARLDEAEATTRKAAGERQDLADREAFWAAEDRADENRKAIVDAEIEVLQQTAEQATTLAERTRIERQILDLKQQELLKAKGKELSRLQETGAITDAQGQQQFDAFKTTLGAQDKSFDQARQGPLKDYLKSVRDLDTEFQNDGVQAIQSLSSGLADAIVNAKSLGDVVRNVFLQLIQQLLAQTIEKSISTLFLAFLADGGPVSGPGGPRSDSVPAMLSDGEYVINARAASQHRGLLDAINSGRALKFADGGPVRSFAALRAPAMIAKAPPAFAGGVTLAVNVAASGAIPREEIEKMVRTGSLQAVNVARQLARGDQARAQYSQALNS